MPENMPAPQGLMEFFSKELICCLGVAMPEGEVHVAPLRFWGDTKDLAIYMATAKDSEKMWWYREGKASVPASVAIGLRDGLPYSIQMRGSLEVFDHTANPQILAEYAKIASRMNDPSNTSNVMIAFRPTWARYTDRSTPEKLTYMIDL